MTIICYEPPAGIIDEREILEDISISAIAILETEDAMENNSDVCTEDTEKKLTELAEQKQTRIKELEAVFEKSAALLDKLQIINSFPV